MLERLPELQRLTQTEKLVLVAELWDDIAAHPNDVPISPELISELDRRMAEYRADPTKVTSWESVQQRLLHSGS